MRPLRLVLNSELRTLQLSLCLEVLHVGKLVLIACLNLVCPGCLPERLSLEIVGERFETHLVLLTRHLHVLLRLKGGLAGDVQFEY